MPNARIETRRGWISGRNREVIEAVHGAMVEALKIPEQDRTLRLFELDPENISTPPNKSERYTLIEITLFAGRSMDAKRKLYQAIVRNLGALGVPALDIKTVLIEVPVENWGVAGGRPASEIDLGFKVDV
jgi:phenylpyruvate tautomerase PptA (4-oxalocrotonate tautomerase family)